VGKDGLCGIAYHSLIQTFEDRVKDVDCLIDLLHQLSAQR